jgi:hypothetical protein
MRYSATRAAIMVAGAVMLLGACTDTVVQPKSTVTEANVFNDPSSYRSFIAKVYAGLAVSGQQGPAGQPDISGIDEGFSQYVRLLWSAQELPTDEAVIGWGDVGLPELNTQLWAGSNSFVVSMYYRVYFQVGMANEFLRQTSDDKLDARGNVSATLRDQIAEYRAEARFLRALSYWHGIDLFGPIPLLTEADPLGNTPPAQATRQEVYDFIVSELQAIIPELPAAGASTYGRATGPAASMLLAKLYLNAEVYTGTANYAGVISALTPVLAQYQLDPNWRRIFMADNHTSPEMIFAVTQDGLRTQTWGGMTFLVHASCGGDMSPAAQGIDGCWWGLRLKPEAYNLYDEDDQRSSVFFTTNQTVGIGSIGNFQNGVASRKYANITSGGSSGSHATHVDTDFPMFRLSDAYLMYAEAVVRGGGGSRPQALGYINDIRERAYGNASGNITDGQMTLDFILDERLRELSWEGHRRTDLIRFGRFTGGDYIWAWKGGSEAGNATESFRDLYPFPANELVANPNLTQNPGY